MKTGLSANQAMRSRLLARAHTRGRFPTSSPSARTVDGIVFDSKREATRYGELKLLERAGGIRDLMLQPSWTIEIGGKKLCRFTADFSYSDDSGTLTVEDVKSKNGTDKDPAFRLRKKAAELAHGISVTVVY